MRFNPSLLCFIVLVSLTPRAELQAQGDEVPLGFENAEASLLSGTPHPALFPDVKIDGYDYLEASVTVEDKGAKVTWAPFLRSSKGEAERGEPKKYSWWQETRLQLSQANDITSLGVALRYNPLNPRSDNGLAKWRQTSVPLEDSSGLLVAKREAVRLLKLQAFEELVRDHRPCPDPLDDLADELLEPPSDPLTGQPLLLLRCHLRRVKDDVEAEARRLEEVNDALGTDLSVAELQSLKQERARLLKRLSELGKRLSSYQRAAERAYIAETIRAGDFDHVGRWQADIAVLEKEIEAAQDKAGGDLYLAYRRKLFATRKPILQVNYVASFFPVLSGGRTDTDNDDLNDNEHQTRTRTLSLTADWSLGTRDAVSLLLSRSNERAAAEKGNPLIDFNGYGLTWSHRVKVLNSDGYQKTKDFKESLFVPSIAFGLAFERKDCRSDPASCPMGRVRTQSITTFVDFKIKKTAQFRIGIPFRRNRVFRAGMADDEEDTIDIVSLVAFQLGAPK